jgi:IS30 family transposase
MKGYKQLTKIQRYQIESLKKAGMLQKDMALIIGVSASALSRELSRNTGKRGYRPEQANNAGSRYFCERFFRAPARKISKNYATANACGCPDSSCFTRYTPNKGCTA